MNTKWIFFFNSNLSEFLYLNTVTYALSGFQFQVTESPAPIKQKEIYWLSFFKSKSSVPFYELENVAFLQEILVSIHCMLGTSGARHDPALMSRSRGLLKINYYNSA